MTLRKVGIRQLRQFLCGLDSVWLAFCQLDWYHQGYGSLSPDITPFLIEHCSIKDMYHTSPDIHTNKDIDHTFQIPHHSTKDMYHTSPDTTSFHQGYVSHQSRYHIIPPRIWISQVMDLTSPDTTSFHQGYVSHQSRYHIIPSTICITPVQIPHHSIKYCITPVLIPYYSIKDMDLTSPDTTSTPPKYIITISEHHIHTFKYMDHTSPDTTRISSFDSKSTSHAHVIHPHKATFLASQESRFQFVSQPTHLSLLHSYFM